MSLFVIVIVLLNPCLFIVYLTPSTCSSDLRKNIENLQRNSITNLRTMVNLGSEVYVQAEV